MIPRILLLISFFTTLKPLCTNLATETTLNAICPTTKTLLPVLYSSLRINKKYTLSIQIHDSFYEICFNKFLISAPVLFSPLQRWESYEQGYLTQTHAKYRSLGCDAERSQLPPCSKRLHMLLLEHRLVWESGASRAVRKAVNAVFCFCITEMTDCTF